MRMRKSDKRLDPEPVWVPVYIEATAQWVARVEQEAAQRGQSFSEFIREAAERVLTSGGIRKSSKFSGVG
jgi:hypothetical protein